MVIVRKIHFERSNGQTWRDSLLTSRSFYFLSKKKKQRNSHIKNKIPRYCFASFKVLWVPLSLYMFVVFIARDRSTPEQLGLLLRLAQVH